MFLCVCIIYSSARWASQDARSSTCLSCQIYLPSSNLKFHLPQNHSSRHTRLFTPNHPSYSLLTPFPPSTVSLFFSFLTHASLCQVVKSELSISFPIHTEVNNIAKIAFISASISDSGLKDEDPLAGISRSLSHTQIHTMSVFLSKHTN